MSEIIDEVSKFDLFMDINNDIFKKIKIKSGWYGNGGKRKTRRKKEKFYKTIY